MTTLTQQTTSVTVMATETRNSMVNDDSKRKIPFLESRISSLTSTGSTVEEEEQGESDTVGGNGCYQHDNNSCEDSNHDDVSLLTEDDTTATSVDSSCIATSALSAFPLPPPISIVSSNSSRNNSNNNNKKVTRNRTNRTTKNVSSKNHVKTSNQTLHLQQLTKRKRTTKFNKWDGDYDPAALVDQSIVLSIGALVFVLALVWPPLILLVAYTASKLIPYSFRVNDSAVTRRKLWKDFCQTATNLPEKFTLLMKNQHPTIQLKQGYWENSRGMLLSTSTLIPKTKPVKAIVCYCHGYSDSASFVKLIENQRLTEEGIAFCAIEYEGHGQSDGALGLIPDWEALIDDVSTYFAQLVSTTPHFQNLPVFLMGESMGGAIAYSVYQRIPHVFRGVVFCCPMCKIADDMLPPQWVIDLLMKIIGPSGTTSLLAYLPIAPSKGKELELYSQKLPEKRALAGRLPLNYCRNPRLATARELIQVTQRISSSLKDFDAPFLVLHGKADRVTDPRLSQALFDESKSADKTIRLYDDMWHALLSAEPDENIDKVYNDIIEWISNRC